MKATYKRLLAATLTAASLMSLGACQDNAGAQAEDIRSGPASQGMVFPAGKLSIDSSLLYRGPQLTVISTDVPQFRINRTALVFASARPKTIEGKLLVPLRETVAQLGGHVQWLDAGRQVLIDLPSQTPVTLDMTRAERFFDETPAADFVVAASPVVLVGNRAYIPFDRLAAALHGAVRWDHDNGVATITTR